MNKTGAGTLAVTNTGNTYASGTVVAAGTLLANNTSGSATGTGSVSVITGAVIGGNGIISPTGTNSVTVAGSLSPGSPETSGGVGTLTFTPASGNVTHTATSTADFQLGTSGLNGLTPTYNPDGTLASVTGTATGGSDRLVFNGGSTSNKLDFSALGAGSFNITFASGYTPADKDLFDLLDWANLSGSNHASAIDGLSTSQLDLPTLSGSLLWDTSLWTSQGVLGIYVVVPEPSRALLILLGLSFTMLRRRK
jgi:autotransporter-associated beta strand protein